jgi:hypothetical protein
MAGDRDRTGVHFGDLRAESGWHSIRSNRRVGKGNAAPMSLFRWPTRIAQYPGLEEAGE